MAQSQNDLDLWLQKLSQAKNKQQIFQILDEFRLLEWTDEQRALMSKAYIRLLEGISSSATASAASDNEAADGPVWYEKM